MVVFTAKITRRRFFSALIAVCILICTAVVAINNNERAETTASEEMVIPNFEEKVRTNEDRVELLKSCGWEVDSEPLEFMEVKIPHEFDEVYNEYNEIQIQQGMDLTKYSGKHVMRYTYKVNNHPSNEEGVVANIIIYKNKLIAGDVCSPKLGGFMHGLQKEANASATEEEMSEEKEEKQD